MSHSRITLTSAQYPPLQADVYSTVQTLGGTAVKLDVAVVDATRLNNAAPLTPQQLSQLFSDTHNVMP